MIRPRNGCCGVYISSLHKDGTATLSNLNESEWLKNRSDLASGEYAKLTHEWPQIA